MEENSEWIHLFDFCKEEVEKKTIYDFNREVDLTNQCGKIVEQMKFNFVDTRQWFYFFNSLYTKITTYQKDCLKKKKTFTKKEKAHRFDAFRRILRKNLRSLEYCLQDVFVDILFDSRFKFNYKILFNINCYEQLKKMLFRLNSRSSKD